MVALTVAELPISSVHANPNQPRKSFEGIEELASSIHENGLLQPITVRPVGESFEIVAGERRFRAMSHLGWETVPAIVRDLEDASAYVLSVMENVARRDMNPMEEAAAFQQLLDSGLSAKEIERKVGIGSGDGGEVTWKVQLLKCIESVQHMLRRGQISQKMATQLARLSDFGQIHALRELQGNALSQNAFTALVDTIWAQENQVDMFPETKIDPAIKAKADAVLAALTSLQRAAAKLDGADLAIIGEALFHKDAQMAGLCDATIQAVTRIRKAVQREHGRETARSLAI